MSEDKIDETIECLNRTYVDVKDTIDHIKSRIVRDIIYFVGISIFEWGMWKSADYGTYGISLYSFLRVILIVDSVIVLWYVALYMHHNPPYKVMNPAEYIKAHPNFDQISLICGYRLYLQDVDNSGMRWHISSLFPTLAFLIFSMVMNIIIFIMWGW